VIDSFRRGIVLRELADGRIVVEVPDTFTLLFKDFDHFVAFTYRCAGFATDKANPARGIPTVFQEAFISQEIIGGEAK